MTTETATAIIQLLQGLLTPAIALLAVYIAYQQYRLGHDKVRLDVFDRRLRIYRAARNALVGVIDEGKSGDDTRDLLERETDDAVFLFGQEIVDHLNRIKHNLTRLGSTQFCLAKVPPVPDEQRARYQEDLDNLRCWFGGELETLARRYKGYLGLRHVDPGAKTKLPPDDFERIWQG